MCRVWWYQDLAASVFEILYGKTDRHTDKRAEVKALHPQLPSASVNSTEAMTVSFKMRSLAVDRQDNHIIKLPNLIVLCA